MGSQMTVAWSHAAMPGEEAVFYGGLGDPFNPNIGHGHRQSCGA